MLGALADAKASLEMVVARRQPDKPGPGIVFLAPVEGKKPTAAARAARALKSVGRAKRKKK